MRQESQKRMSYGFHEEPNNLSRSCTFFSHSAEVNPLRVSLSKAKLRNMYTHCTNLNDGASPLSAKRFLEARLDCLEFDEIESLCAYIYAQYCAALLIL